MRPTRGAPTVRAIEGDDLLGARRMPGLDSTGAPS